MRDNKKYQSKKYLHFDSRIEYTNVQKYVEDPMKIEKHNFYPLLKYTQSTDKFDATQISIRDDKLPIKTKPRNIMYACHKDNFIYRYYGELLNEAYSKWAKENDINEESIAYREPKYSKSNIDSAAEVINAIVEYQYCYIIVGDFESYFDSLDHQLLKKRVKIVLNMVNLEEDWYRVFRSVTRYSYCEKELINSLFGTDKYLRKKRKFSYFDNTREYREFKKKYKISFNKNDIGIPQGTAISAVLANVYAILFDKEIKSLVKDYNGLYRRYSDDFIIVIPAQGDFGKSEFNELASKINTLAAREKLKIHLSKTHYLQYEQNEIKHLDSNITCNLDYLGFAFDGENVRMRSKSPYKFYRKANRLIEKAKKAKEKKNLKKLPYRKKIYTLYTDAGINSTPYGNFITYAIKAQKAFDEISPNTNNLILQQIKNRKTKIEKKLGYRISFKH
ncbi:RNA-dependent DNA polymerase [Sporosarcina sp. P34]|uniref:reverse transcriptase/maturase family protein n=1 Tax=Sporosarcina sp. P34 TaxID=2048247 RepID=UPI000C170015|nr:reverse transcriptase/maturase family protein [Sporosarcina sp. P34]PID14413.1 RNA-dependent DNA polymerase [Sporosarcina sp. P34]